MFIRSRSAVRSIALAIALAAPTLAQPSNSRDSRAGAPSGSESERVVITNDLCSNPALISGPGLFDWDNRNAGTDGLPHAACFFSSSAQIYKDIWAVWTASCDGPVTVETCGLTSLDTKIAVYATYQLPCPPTDPWLLTCADDSCGFQTKVTFTAVAGQNYLIRLGQYNAGAPGGTGQFRITCAASGVPSVCLNGSLCQDPNQSIGYTSSGGFRCADDFTLNASGVVDGVCWWGGYSGDIVADNFSITYYEDISGAPGRPVARFGGSQVSVRRTPTPRIIPVGVQEFGYSACHAPLTLIKGRRYWIEIVNNIGSTWYWETATTGGNFRQDPSPADPYTNSSVITADGGGLAFCLSYTTGCPIDANGDGVIDFLDLNLVLDRYGTACP